MKICSQWHTKFTKAGSKNRLWCHLKRAFLFRNWLLLRIPRSSYFSANLGETEDHVKTIHSGAQSLPITFSLSLSLSLSQTHLLSFSFCNGLQSSRYKKPLFYLSLFYHSLFYLSLSLSLTQLCAQLSWNCVTVRRRRRSATVSCLCEPRPQRGGCWKFWDELENEKSVWATTLSDASVNYFDSNFWT